MKNVDSFDDVSANYCSIVQHFFSLRLSERPSQKNVASIWFLMNLLWFNRFFAFFKFLGRVKLWPYDLNCFFNAVKGARNFWRINRAFLVEEGFFFWRIVKLWHVFRWKSDESLKFVIFLVHMAFKMRHVQVLNSVEKWAILVVFFGFLWTV